MEKSYVYELINLILEQGGPVYEAYMDTFPEYFHADEDGCSIFSEVIVRQLREALQRLSKYVKD
jgi:hypothetical protein